MACCGRGHAHGAWRMAHGAWRMAHGAWRMAHGAWRCACVREGGRLKKCAACLPHSRVAPVHRRLVAGASAQPGAVWVAAIVLEELVVSPHPRRADRVLLAVRCTQDHENVVGLGQRQKVTRARLARHTWVSWRPWTDACMCPAHATMCRHALPWWVVRRLRVCALHSVLQPGNCVRHRPDKPRWCVCVLVVWGLHAEIRGLYNREVHPVGFSNSFAFDCRIPREVSSLSHTHTHSLAQVLHTRLHNVFVHSEFLIQKF